MKIFLSYSRLDDLPPLERVSKLRQRFATALTQARGEPCRVHFDRVSIRWGAKWRRKTDELIRGADAFMAILTPSFFNSRMCLHEFDVALTQNLRILPVYFANCRRLHCAFDEHGKDAELASRYNRISRKISDFQMKDFRSLKTADYDSREVQDFLDGMAEELC
jgi:hypothetical protein